MQPCKSAKSKVVAHKKSATKSKTHKVDMAAQYFSNVKKKLKTPVVGIGSSAGGLDALEEFFRNMPVAGGMAFVIIQHLDPKDKGMLREILQKSTLMKVITATDGISIKPNTIYIIPPNKSMSILNNGLHLFDPIEKQGLRLPIDYFFRSLADDRHDESMGIVLSGMGSDGSLGLQSIKAKGGLTLVQDPATAKFDSMPRSAIDAVKIDGLAGAAGLPEKLFELLKRPWVITSPIDAEKNKNSLEKIIIQLREHTGNDFSLYKKSTLYRRIERRMGIHDFGKMPDYVRFLRENSIEAQLLFKELLIGVTAFFRDPMVWDELRDHIFPEMFRKISAQQTIRAWVAGCSTGEEALTLAMTFTEAADKLDVSRSLALQIFATDIDPRAIEIARKGLYPLSISDQVSPERLNRFFVKEDNLYRVCSKIREMVVFATHNVIRDPPFTKLHLLTCRNLLIYLEPEAQKKLMWLFHYSLQTNGILLLGNAESISSENDLYSTVNSKMRIYKHVDLDKRIFEPFDFPNSSANHQLTITAKQKVFMPDNLQSLTEQLLLQKFMPAGILVNDKGDILYFIGSTGKYLEPDVGKANMNIFSMAREGLRSVLPGALRRATKNYERIVYHNIKLAENHRAQKITLTLQQIENPQALNGKILILFNDEVSPTKPAINPKKTAQNSVANQAELEDELIKLRKELKNTMEEMQISQEEQKS